jgi:hypothetical protein
MRHPTTLLKQQPRLSKQHGVIAADLRFQPG